jgi:hypothetical protein
VYPLEELGIPNCGASSSSRDTLSGVSSSAMAGLVFDGILEELAALAPAAVEMPPPREPGLHEELLLI